eukprot:TRINITY_DN107193_c0_g1_i1.p1 TRINITY_DN107193_c0_g1~~TRINITY_DN107193_c0_g1_i1.p1  ORF type:complete len:304 (+),score=73.82 TRINITY_DN107193_c0_g1_i1:31-912(+)
MSLLASETQGKVAAVQAALQTVERHLEPLLAKSPKEVSRNLAALENAELQVSLAYAVTSLYFCHLLTQGVDPADHPIRQELDRIQLYFKKVRSAAEEANEKEASKERARVDAEAAHRIVRHFAHAADASAQRRTEAAASSSGAPKRPASAEGSASAEGESPAKMMKAAPKASPTSASEPGPPAKTFSITSKAPPVVVGTPAPKAISKTPSLATTLPPTGKAVSSANVISKSPPPTMANTTSAPVSDAASATPKAIAPPPAIAAEAGSTPALESQSKKKPKKKLKAKPKKAATP